MRQTLSRVVDATVSGTRAGAWARDGVGLSQKPGPCLFNMGSLRIATQLLVRLGGWGYSVVVFAGGFDDPTAATGGQGSAFPSTC